MVSRYLCNSYAGSAKMFHGQWNGVDVYLRLLSKWNDVKTVNYLLYINLLLSSPYGRVQQAGGPWRWARTAD